MCGTACQVLAIQYIRWDEARDRRVPEEPRLSTANARLSLRVTAALAAHVGLYHGYVNGSGMGPSGFAGMALVGLGP